MAGPAHNGQEREVISNHDIVNEETALLSGQAPPVLDDDEEQECWNSPAINSYRFISVNLTLVILGLNDSCIGALIPYIEPYYDISYTKVSTLFVVPFAGYLAAALINSWIHLTVGQRGIAFFGPFCRLIGYVPMALHPRSFWVLPVCLTFTGFGNGISDSAWNAWVGNLQSTNELLGIIHGLYGAGGIIGPLIASAMVTKLGLQWYEYYYVMIAVSILELIWGTASFWKATAAAYRRKHKFGEGREPAKTSEVLQSPVPWLVSMVLFGYVGAEVCLGGWIPTFMINVRHADGFTAGLTVTLFWAGFTLGRVALGFITGRIGEKLAITIYLAISMTFQVLYWAIPSIEATIVFVVILGFFLGPVFPAAIVVMTKLLPPDQHVISIGLTAALGGGGSAVFPFIVGAIAEHHGVKVLQPFVLAVLAVVGILWMSIPGGMKKGGLEKARKEGFEVGGFVKGLFRGSQAPK